MENVTLWISALAVAIGLAIVLLVPVVHRSQKRQLDQVVGAFRVREDLLAELAKELGAANADNERSAKQESPHNLNATQTAEQLLDAWRDLLIEAGDQDKDLLKWFVWLERSSHEDCPVPASKRIRRSCQRSAYGGRITEPYSERWTGHQAESRHYYWLMSGNNRHIHSAA